MIHSTHILGYLEDHPDGIAGVGRVLVNTVVGDDRPGDAEDDAARRADDQ